MQTFQHNQQQKPMCYTIKKPKTYSSIKKQHYHTCLFAKFQQILIEGLRA